MNSSGQSKKIEKLFKTLLDNPENANIPDDSPQKTNQEIQNLLSDIQRSIFSVPLLKDILNSLKHLILIVTPQGEIIFFNREIESYFNEKGVLIEEGKTPCQALGCIMSDVYEQGEKVCHETCGIIKRLRKEGQCTGEFTLNPKVGKIIQWSISSTRIPIVGSDYYMLSIKDISQQKFLETFENIFFHDLKNSTGNLQELTKSLSTFSHEDKVKAEKLIQRIASKLHDEILSQEQLFNVNFGKVHVNIQEIDSLSFLKEAAETYSSLYGIQSNVQISSLSQSHLLYSDKTLLSRILANMIKNSADHRSSEDETIRLGCQKEDKNIVFWVNDSNYIPPQIQKNIFIKQHSSKNKTRGWGTYSIKILSEKYLGGRVSFESNESNGTTFLVSIPIKR